MVGEVTGATATTRTSETTGMTSREGSSVKFHRKLKEEDYISHTAEVRVRLREFEVPRQAQDSRSSGGSESPTPDKHKISAHLPTLKPPTTPNKYVGG